MTDSTTGGILRPSDNSPVNAFDDDLDDALQEMVVGLTGLTGRMVRPRWQPSPPKEPAVTTNWCAIGVIDHNANERPTIIHDGTGEGQDVLYRTEQIRVMASFYGPKARELAGQLRDGLYVAQNRDELRVRKLWIQDVGSIVMAPDLVNMNWRRKADLQMTFTRQIDRTYPVRNLLSAQGEIVSDDKPSVNFETEK